MAESLVTKYYIDFLYSIQYIFSDIIFAEKSKIILP